ncbi:hypothetical protein DOTSEDRAFT_39029 [Dothistroma septosporum NZE10]|uniref:Uncharacterized protein n=1 Tax=Dothistroma septosporum (strain NZE10 / CBS 128990) TaxID=675120 RepID=M2Y0J2_DOTSN|nr:hypothetical protein DOTSEDRAFT_39029 [Dothistroma septosporum NZE10]
MAQSCAESPTRDVIRETINDTLSDILGNATSTSELNSSAAQYRTIADVFMSLPVACGAHLTRRLQIGYDRDGILLHDELEATGCNSQPSPRLSHYIIPLVTLQRHGTPGCGFVPTT